MTNLPVLPPRPPRPSRLSSKLRIAIHARVVQGMSITDACKKAGLSTAGWHKAVQRDAVAQHLQEVQSKFIAETDQARAHAKRQAIVVAVDLMTNAKSESIRARMAEFLAGDGKGPAVQVTIDARQAFPPTNYTFSRPPSLDAVPEAVAAPPEGE